MSGNNWICISKELPKDENQLYLFLHKSGFVRMVKLINCDFVIAEHGPTKGVKLEIREYSDWLLIPPQPKPKPDKTVATAIVRGKYDSIYCPQCNENLELCDGRKITFPYCPYCTQKLDWTKPGEAAEAVLSECPHCCGDIDKCICYDDICKQIY